MKKNEKKRVIQRTDCDIINQDTGEVLSSKSYKTFQVDNEPDYIKLYLADIAKLSNLPRGASSVLNELLKYMNYENIVVLNSFIKQHIADVLGTNVPVLEHQITSIINEGIMCRVGRGTYFVNPEIFGRGKWQDVYNMRLTITYDASGRKFKAERNVVDTQQELDGDGFEKPKGINGLPIWLCT